jgi:hypothetical protein
MVWIPAVYFYLGDYSPAPGLEEAEEGQAKEAKDNRRR